MEGEEETNTAGETGTNPQDDSESVGVEKEEAEVPGEPSTARSPYEDKAARTKLQEDALPLVLEAMWAANVIDIQNTLRKVLCENHLYE